MSPLCMDANERERALEQSLRWHVAEMATALERLGWRRLPPETRLEATADESTMSTQVRKVHLSVYRQSESFMDWAVTRGLIDLSLIKCGDDNGSEGEGDGEREFPEDVSSVSLKLPDQDDEARLDPLRDLRLPASDVECATHDAPALTDSATPDKPRSCKRQHGSDSEEPSQLEGGGKRAKVQGELSRLVESANAMDVRTILFAVQASISSADLGSGVGAVHHFVQGQSIEATTLIPLHTGNVRA